MDQRSVVRALAALVLVCLWCATAARADETCNSPYISKLIKGQEDYVYVWTLGVEGLGDGSDKLVTIDVNPKSKGYGKVIHSVSTGARAEAHHMGLTDDRRHIWAGGLSDNRIWVFDIATNPAKPKLAQTITDLGDKSGYLGPHTYYALPGRMLVQDLVQHQGQERRDGHGAVQQPGQAAGLLCDANQRRRRRLRLRSGGEPEKERDADLELHRLQQLHAAARRAW